jgi:hypothetical protein
VVVTRELFRGFSISDESRIAVDVDGKSLGFLFLFDLDFMVDRFKFPDVSVEINGDRT